MLLSEYSANMYMIDEGAEWDLANNIKKYQKSKICDSKNRNNCTNNKSTKNVSGSECKEPNSIIPSLSYLLKSEREVQNENLKWNDSGKKILSYSDIEKMQSQVVKKVVALAEVDTIVAVIVKVILVVAVVVVVVLS